MAEKKVYRYLTITFRMVSRTTALSRPISHCGPMRNKP